MELTYTLTEEDYLRFNVFHIKNSATGKKALNIQRYVTPVFFVVIAYVFSIILHKPFLEVFLPFFIVGALWVLFYPKYFYNHITRTVKKAFREGNNEGLLGQHRLTIDDEGFVDETANGLTRLAWAGVVEVKEDEHSLYIYNSAVSAYILPKQEIDKVEGFRKYLNVKLKI
ncbi:hypothetical protein Q73_15875 [Bacillus coahuilensis m2-6]|uniref:YcxB family protein n=1 Tax=Bacillus coahuilensis TaxID=408580 RepID=UPI0007987AB0|nr:YcxB family protein [Bacillus coahuilensis]KUP04350.1 hypothetical protein Q73_15875 [Bacillus coahuilensis m2-6]